MKTNRTPLVAAGCLLSIACFARAAEPAVVATFVGDGLTVRVLTWGESDGSVSGEILKGTQKFPFTGTHAEAADGTETVRGTFRVGENAFDFITTQSSEDEAVFKTGTTTYRLKRVPDAPAKPAVPNPLSPTTPAAATPAATPVAGPADAGVQRLRMHAFPDVSMGAPQAYTVITPADWRTDGRVEWRQIGQQPFPQTLFTITSPQGGRITYVPNLTLAYTNAPALGQREGIPPPADFPDWYAKAIPETNKKVTNVRMISSQRHAGLEAQWNAKDRELNANTAGMKREIWHLNYEYDEAGVRRREETIITYVAYQPFNGLAGFQTQSWALFFMPFVSAPAEQWDGQKKLLYDVAGTVRPTVRWFTLSQQVIAENSRQRQADMWAQIKARGEAIKSMHVTPADEQKYTAGLNSDAAQAGRVDAINERENYRDADGSLVNLPIHGKYKWTDGQGNIAVTNTYQKPGENYQEMSPAK